MEILLTSAYLRLRKYTGCQCHYATPDDYYDSVVNNENNLFED